MMMLGLVVDLKEGRTAKLMGKLKGTIMDTVPAGKREMMD